MRDDDNQRREVRTPLVRRVVARSIASPINLSIAGAAVAGAAVLHSWPLGALGGVAYAALVAWNLVNPDFWRKAVSAETAVQTNTSKIPNPNKIADPGLRQTAAGILAARTKLHALLDEATGDVPEQLAGATVAIDELEKRAAGLLKSGDQLIGYLAQGDADDVRREIDRLRARAAQTSDAEARDQYERSVKAREEQLAVVTDITNAVERVQANLSRIVATLEGLSAKVVRTGAIDAQAMDDLAGDLNAEVERMNREIDTFERTLHDVLARP